MDEEELVLRMLAEGFQETVDAIHEVTDALDEMSERADVARDSVGGAEGGRGKGVFGALTSFKALIAGLGIYKAVKSFAQFQSQMERLRTQTGATQGEVGRMSKGILGMAASVGTGPQGLAQALYHIESAGFRGKKALDALRLAAEGAKVGGADLTDTTTSLTAVLVAGLAKGRNAAQQLRTAMGQLNATVGAGDMTFSDLNSALGRGILTTFAEAGLKTKDLGASLAVLGDNNMRGTKAATMLRQAIMEMIGPSDVAAAQMKKLGLGPLELSKELQKPNGLLRALELVKEKMKGLSKPEMENAAVNMFTRQGATGILTLIRELPRLKTKYDDITKSGNDFNAEWQATTKTLQFFLDQCEALGEVLLIKLGGALARVIGWFRSFIGALKGGKLWAQAIAVTLGVIVDVVGSIILVTKAWTLAQAALNLVMNVNPWLVAFTAIVAIIVLLVLHWKTVKQVAGDVLHAVVKWLKDAWDWTKKAAGVVGHALVGAFDGVKHALEDVWKIAKKVFDFIIGKGGTVSKILSYMNPLGDAAHAFDLGKHILGHFAGGTDSVPQSGAYVVGERGPEVVYLNKGSTVVPNSQLGANVSGDQQPQVLEATLVNVMDGKVVSRTVVREGLMATARRGAGGATLTTAGV